MKSLRQHFIDSLKESMIEAAERFAKDTEIDTQVLLDLENMSDEEFQELHITKLRVDNKLARFLLGKLNQ